MRYILCIAYITLSGCVAYISNERMALATFLLAISFLTIIFPSIEFIKRLDKPPVDIILNDF